MLVVSPRMGRDASFHRCSSASNAESTFSFRAFAPTSLPRKSVVPVVALFDKALVFWRPAAELSNAGFPGSHPVRRFLLSAPLPGFPALRPMPSAWGTVLSCFAPDSALRFRSGRG